MVTRLAEQLSDRQKAGAEADTATGLQTRSLTASDTESR